MGEKEESVFQLALISIPGMGHLIPMVELAKRLIQVNVGHHHRRRRLAITILLIPPPKPDPNISSFLSSTSTLHSSISFLHLPFLPPPPSSPNLRALISTRLSVYIPSITSALLSLHSAAVVVDFFCCHLVEDVPVKLNIPSYIFFTSSAAMLSLMLLIPSIDHLIPDDRKAMELIRDHVMPFPGFSSGLPLPCFPDQYARGKDDEMYQMYVRLGLLFRKATGILVNTFVELELGVVRALEEGNLDHSPIPPVYPVGPLLSLPLEEEGKKKHECILWLDEQPRGSVVFLCFGSMGSFSQAQVKEVAVGLERSGHAFLWVMRNEGLPEGFEERTKGRGLVWKSFAPQREILGHEAVGGFVTHCGWNSCLESLWYGVPMAAWPRYAEQHLNAFEMVEEMEVAVEVKIDRLGGNAATAEEVERVVKVLMGEESKKQTENVRKMEEEARRALEKEGDGSSYTALNKFLEVVAGDAPSQRI